MRTVVTALVIATTLAATSSQLLAHHSLAAQFDENTSVTLDGVISKVEWVNPHVYLYLDTTDAAGKVSTWALETFPPITLRRGGLTKEKLGLGQKVSVLAFKARNGTPMAFLRKITFPDGREIIIWLGDVEQASKAK